MNFKSYPLGNLVNIRYGKNQKKVASEKGTFPIYGTGGLMGYAIEPLYDKPSVLIGRKGTIDKVRYVTHPFWTVDTLFYTEIDDTKVLPHYLYYYLSLLDLKKYNEGTTIPSLRTETLNRIEISVPEIEEQQRVLALLEPIDSKIETNKQINDNLLEQASTLFNSAIQQSTSVVYAELGSLAEVKGGKRLPKGVNLVTTPNQHPYIRVRDLNNTVFASLSNDYEYVDDETQQSISRYTVSTGDLLISIVGTIGLTAIVDHTLNKANLTENCVKLTNIKNVTPEYLLLFLRSLQGVEAISKGTVGAVQLKLPIKNIQSITVPLLCDEELQPLQETLSAIFSQISANIVEMKQLADIRDTLLPKLMSGELDVSSFDL